MNNTITIKEFISVIIFLISTIILIEVKELPKPIKIILSILIFPVLPIIFLIKEIKDMKNYNKYKKEMNKIYNKKYCPLINENCCYEYCEFWNNEKKDCNLKINSFLLN